MNSRDKLAAQRQLLSLIRTILLSLIIMSCQINGTLQGFYGYQHKILKEHPGFIQEPFLPICQTKGQDTSHVYSVNGKELKRCINSIQYSLVYIWRPNCSSSTCVSPLFLQNLCDENCVELFIIAEYYDFEMMSMKYNTSRPIFGVNTDYYRTNRTIKYIDLFRADLLDGTEIQSNEYFYLFEKGILKSHSRDINGIVFSQKK